MPATPLIDTDAGETLNFNGSQRKAHCEHGIDDDDDDDGIDDATGVKSRKRRLDETRRELESMTNQAMRSGPRKERNRVQKGKLESQSVGRSMRRQSQGS